MELIDALLHSNKQSALERNGTRRGCSENDIVVVVSGQKIGWSIGFSIVLTLLSIALVGLGLFLSFHLGIRCSSVTLFLVCHLSRNLSDTSQNEPYQE